jgi:hypothetical protein
MIEAIPDAVALGLERMPGMRPRLLDIHQTAARAAASLVKADNWRCVSEAAARYASVNHELTLGQLKRIARGARS